MTLSPAVRVAFVSALLLLSACSVKRDFYAIGGSRADGTIDLAYDFKMFEKSVVNKDQAFAMAKSKCGRWGYNDAEPFGGQVESCQARNGYGDCLRGQVIVKFQCLGSLEAAARPSPLALPATVSTLGTPMSADQYKEAQIQALMQQGLPYEEYSRRYKAIMGQ